MKTSFLIKRLLQMSPQEIIHRIDEQFKSEYDMVFSSKRKIRPEVLAYPENMFGDVFELKTKDQIIIIANAFCENKFSLFSQKDICLDDGINYYKDYKSGLSAPNDRFGKKIDYRDSDKIGDIKYIWETNRLLALLPLAIASKFSDEDKYINKFEELISNWFEQNTFMYGVNWTSSLELGIRLVNWSICWQLVEDKLKSSIREKWIESIYQHCWYINRYFSRFSSANNHLIGEAAGLFIASIALPQFKESAKWKVRASRILHEEAQKQTYSDGVNKEQAVSYQQFVLDFLLISGVIARKYKCDFEQKYWNLIERMIDYISSIQSVPGFVPQIGDEDDGLVIDIGQKACGIYKSLLTTGAFLFNRKDFFGQKAELDPKSELLLKIAGIDCNKSPERTRISPYMFEEGGYYILGTNFGQGNEQKTVFDCGSLGYLSIAAHGHADALSFVFSAGGCPIFIDPGTYAYHTEKVWRDYFRGTKAHNTICIDGINQSVITGSFMWGKKASAGLISYTPTNNVKGWHDGYERLKDKVKHVRELSYDNKKDQWTIVDEIICNGSHEAEVTFNLHPDCTCSISGNTAVINFFKGQCVVEFDECYKIYVEKGVESPPSGWYSPSYDIKVPANRLFGKTIVTGKKKMVVCYRVSFN